MSTTDSTNPTPRTFRLGLTLAGAVSAGAYSAGVLDFLREALEAWERAKAAGEDSAKNPVPTHRVQIEAISGTSAGAMCAAMFLGALGKNFVPVRDDTLPEQSAKNPLYQAWVQRVDIQPMLDDDDLLAEGPVKSLLNCRILEEIAGEVLTPWPSGFALPNWIAPDAELFICTTSLRGIPYGVSAYAGQAAAYGMSLHSGVMKYRLADAAGCANPDGEVLAHDAPAAGWDSLRNAALASGAFPFALKARTTDTPLTVINERRWEIPTDSGRRLAESAEIKPNLGDIKPFKAVCVDGGAINNEPVEHVRLALALRKAGATEDDIPRLDRALDKAEAATLLIDPFPDEVAFNEAYKSKDDLWAVVKDLFPAIMNQLRFKTDELVLAAASAIGSRYLISPTRRSPTGESANPALACGELGGFIGFLDQSFRHHDYLLGRLNCQRFLERHFYMAFSTDKQAAGNPIFTGTPDGYRGEGYFSAADLAAIRAEQPDNVGIVPVPVIPLMPELRGIKAVLGGSSELKWPAYDANGLKTLKRRLRNRLDAVISRMLELLPLKWLRHARPWLLSGIATLLRLNPADLAAEKIMKTIEEKLIKAKLMKSP